jgi:rubrerythrin
MKKIVNFVVIATIAVFIASCGGNKKTVENKVQQDTIKKVNQTVENLKAALQGETNASAKYEAFAVKAKEEKLPQIATLFNAASKSESIHAANHKKVLEEMGIKVDVKPQAFDVKTTKENLDAAYAGEKHEVENMYKGYIDQADADDNDKAVKSFSYAFETEKKHMTLYKTAIDALAANKVKTLAVEYLVCPKCGYTYTKKDVVSECIVCSTSKDKFISII